MNTDPSLYIFNKRKPMSTALVIPDMNLPAHLQGITPEENAAASAGIKAGGFPRISLAGSKFHLIKDGDRKVIPSLEDPSLPMMRLEAIVVGWSPFTTKTYYEGDYSEDDDQKEPDCRSDDGIVPDADVAVKQSPTCALCPQNVWGSKVSKYSGKDTKACSDGKRLVLIPAQAMDSEAIALNVTPAALKAWKQYVDALSAKGVPLSSVVTGFTFDATANFPKLLFNWMRFLSAEEYAKAKERRDSAEVKSIASPRSVTSARALPAPAAQQAVSAPAQPPAPPKPPEPPKPVQQVVDTRLAHLDAGMKAAITAVGIDSVAGQAILAQFPAPSPVAPPAPVAPPPPPPDPYANVPEAIRPAIQSAVTGAGGPDSPAGKAILGGFPPPKAASKSRGRPAKTVDTPPEAPAAPAVVAAPAAATPPVTPVKGFASGPVATGADLATNLEKMLQEAMSGSVGG